MAIKSGDGPLASYKDKDLNIYYGKKVIGKLNIKLLDKMDAWHNLEEIKSAHVVKHVATELMKKTDSKDIENLKLLDEALTATEFWLQSLWGFPLNTKYHKFWERPHCSCPKMDNNERWPVGYYVISADCVLHGNGNILTSKPPTTVELNDKEVIFITKKSIWQRIKEAFKRW